MEQYLKGDYRIHLKEKSRVADHCILWALSDPKDKDFQVLDEFNGKDHTHNYICQQCKFIDDKLEEIQNLLINYKKSRESDKNRPVTESELEELEEKMGSFEDAVANARAMRNHFVRAARSHQSRQHAIKNLKQGWAYMTIDWAQKLDPLYFSETQRVREFCI